MLEVLTRREITDAVAVTTRYYGGIKLGAGGLVRAYGRSVAEALDTVGTVRRAPHTLVEVTIDHAEAGRLENELRGAGHRIAATDYGTEVRFTLHIPAEATERFTRWLAERTKGHAAARFGEELLIDLPDG
jgi:putative IMPACT (imprinted ancient) family translation regulator